MLGRGIEVLLWTNHVRRASPRRNHLPLHVPVGEIGRAPAQVPRHFVAVLLVEVVFIDLARLNHVEVAVDHAKTIFHAELPPTYYHWNSTAVLIPSRIN